MLDLYTAAFVGLALACWFMSSLLFDENSPLLSFLPQDFARRLAAFHFPYETEKSFFDPKYLSGLQNVVTRHDCHTESEILKGIADSPYIPVLFKGVYDSEKVESLLNDFKELTTDRTFTAFNLAAFRPVDQFGSFCTVGAHLTREEWENIFDNEYTTHQSFEPVIEGKTQDIYSAFVPVGNLKTGYGICEMLGFKQRKAVADTSFVGNMSRHVVSTPIHANWPADTLSIQLAGYKQWLIASPSDMKEVLKDQPGCKLYASRQGGVYYHGLKVSPLLQSKFKLAVVEPGDMLYFPPYAPHMVMSGKGVNVMTALRFADDISIRKGLLLHPIHTTKKAVEHVLFHIFQGVKALIQPSRGSKFNQDHDPTALQGYYQKTIINTQGTPYNDDALQEHMETMIPSKFRE